MVRPYFRIRWLGTYVAGTIVFLLLPIALSGQDPDGWIAVLEPSEWSGEVTRGIVVVRKNSIRIGGSAFQPGGIDRILINGRRAQLDPQANGEVRFVGYADTDTLPGQVEVVAYASGPRPPVVREYSYAMSVEIRFDQPEEAFARREFQGERYAVVIGISDYADPAITPLRYADDDAQSFYDFLTSEAAGLGGFRPENIRLLLNEEADSRSVRTALTTFLRRATEQDVVVIYLAGHGSPDPDRPEDYYLLTHDSEAESYPGTAISMEDISLYVRQLRARDIIVFTDACHSAAVSGSAVGLRAGETNAINELFLERLQATAAGLLSFTASETNQFSQESDRWGGGHGVFTYQLLRGLEGEADEDGDGIVTLGELVEFTRFAVQRETRGAQVPFVGSGSFDRSWPMSITTPRVVTDSEAEAVSSELRVDELSDSRAEAIAVRAGLMSPAGVFAHSLVIPGSGQFRTERGWRGSLVLAGSIGAVAYGFLSKTVTKRCREATVGGACLSGQYTDVQTQRPDLVAGLAAAGALTLIGAVDALLGAKKVNSERLAAVRDGGSAGNRVSLLPTGASSGSRPGDLRLLELRFRQ